MLVFLFKTIHEFLENLDQEFFNMNFLFSVFSVSKCKMKHFKQTLITLKDYTYYKVLIGNVGDWAGLKLIALQLLSGLRSCSRLSSLF